MALENLLNDLKNMKLKLKDWGAEAIEANKKSIVDLVKYGQLSQGLNSIGSPLAFQESNGNTGTGFYAKETQSYADADGVKKPKTAGNPYNFSWTGGTLDKMYLKAINKNKASYEIFSKDFKAKMLEQIYGEIFDLTDEHNSFVNEFIIKPYIAQKIEQELNKIASRI